MEFDRRPTRSAFNPGSIVARKEKRMCPKCELYYDEKGYHYHTKMCRGIRRPRASRP